MTVKIHCYFDIEKEIMQEEGEEVKEGRGKKEDKEKGKRETSEEETSVLPPISEVPSQVYQIGQTASF